MTEVESTQDALLLREGWSDQSIRIWLRARGFCEYCHRDLLAGSDDYFLGRRSTTSFRTAPPGRQRRISRSPVRHAIV
jgi:hypothetical protein